jgi:WS/DGAT/MGAT family acyltransferase
MDKLIQIGAFDRLLLRSESRQTPAHTASLNVYRLPANAKPDFVHQLYLELKRWPVSTPPFSYVLAGTLRSPRGWRVADHVDLDFHVRYATLARPGDEDALATLVSQLHSGQLDFSRPLWEFHLIAGMSHNRFATYLKMHHAFGDGATVVRIITSMLNERPTDPPMPPPWALREGPLAAGPSEPHLKARAATGPRAESASLLRALWRTTVAQLRRRRTGLVAPYASPRCMLNGLLTPARCFRIQSYSILRLKALAEAAGGTINDVLLATCSGAIRRYLLEQHALPEKSVIASVPTALERRSDEHLGSVTGLLTVTLATDLADPKARMETIMQSSRQAKANLRALPRWKVDIYNRIVMLPFLRGRLAHRRRPIGLMGNLPISNVPGPKGRLYFHGADVEAMYPCSVIMQGYAINITARGYHDTINLGILGCPTLLPDFESFAEYIPEALAELETRYRICGPETPPRNASQDGIAGPPAPESRGHARV